MLVFEKYANFTSNLCVIRIELSVQQHGFADWPVADVDQFFIHRPLAVIHLPAPGTNLFPMAGVRPWAVIYNIIAAKMETLHNINTIRNSSIIRPGVRLALTVIGIVAAIICFFTLLSEVRSSADVATVSHLVEASRIVPGDFLVGATGVNPVSALWPF